MRPSVKHKYLLSILLSARHCTYSWGRWGKDNRSIYDNDLNHKQWRSAVRVLSLPHNTPNTTVNFYSGNFVKEISPVLESRSLSDWKKMKPSEGRWLAQGHTRIPLSCNSPEWTVRLLKSCECPTPWPTKMLREHSVLLSLAFLSNTRNIVSLPPNPALGCCWKLAFPMPLPTPSPNCSLTTKAPFPALRHCHSLALRKNLVRYKYIAKVTLECSEERHVKEEILSICMCPPRCSTRCFCRTVLCSQG